MVSPLPGSIHGTSTFERLLAVAPDQSSADVGQHLD
jgi:hypothetical protein